MIYNYVYVECIDGYDVTVCVLEGVMDNVYGVVVHGCDVVAHVIDDDVIDSDDDE